MNMKIIKIEWMNRYKNNTGDKGTVRYTQKIDMMHAKCGVQWFGVGINIMRKPVNVNPNCLDDTVWFVEPALLSSPKGHETGEYDQRITVMDDKTGEVFYTAEMLRENYPSGSNEPFNLCWEIVKKIDSLQNKEIENRINEG